MCLQLYIYYVKMNKTRIYNLKLIVGKGRSVTQEFTEALLGAQSFTRELVAKKTFGLSALYHNYSLSDL